MQLGKQIASYRKQKGMTQEDLGKLLNISNQAVSKWEANQSSPDITLLTKLADIFEVSLDQLFGREWHKEERTNFSQTLPWEDDGELRAVVYVGTKLALNEKLTSQQKQICERVTFVYEGEALLNVASEFNVCCEMVNGNVSAGNNVECNNIGGDVQAGDSVSCNDVDGCVNAGDGVECNNVGGDVHAGDGVECNNVGGDVHAGDGVECNNVGGMVTAGDSVHCYQVAGDVYAEQVFFEEE